MLTRRDTDVWAHNYAFGPETRYAYTTSSTFEKEDKLDWHKAEPDNYDCATPRVEHIASFYSRLEVRARSRDLAADAEKRASSRILGVWNVW